MSPERRLERVLLEGQQRNGQLQEQLSQQLSQSLSTAVCNRLERTIREEMKKTVPQCECGALQLHWDQKHTFEEVLVLSEAGIRLCEHQSVCRAGCSGPPCNLRRGAVV